MTNLTNRKDTYSTGEPREAVVKKPYEAPSLRFEPVFEVSALACGKVYSTQSGCHSSLKAS